MLVIPSRFLAAIGRAVSRDVVMYALKGVRISDLGDGKFRLAASDGKRLLMVEGAGLKPEDFPSVPNFDPSKNGVTEAIVPVEVLKAAAKATAKKTAIPALQHVAITMHEENKGDVPTVTLAATTLENAAVMPVRAVEAKFPDVESVVKNRLSKPSEMTVYFNARLLADTLQAIADMTDLAASEVRFDLRDATGALQISAVDGDGFEVSALVMPLQETNIPMTPKAIINQEAKPETKRKAGPRRRKVAPSAPTAEGGDDAEGAPAPEPESAAPAPAAGVTTSEEPANDAPKTEEPPAPTAEAA